MVAAGLPWSSWLVAGAFMNLRHILFAVSMVPRWHGWTRLQRALASSGLTDEASAEVASQKGRFESFPHAAGTALAASLSWIGGTVGGAWGECGLPTGPGQAAGIRLARALRRSARACFTGLAGGPGGPGRGSCLPDRNPVGPWLVGNCAGRDPRGAGRRHRG